MNQPLRYVAEKYGSTIQPWQPLAECTGKENATSKLEATVEQGRYASFRIDQALDHPKASRLVLQQMIASLEEVIGQLFIFEAGSRINTNRYTCLISQFREKQALAKRALEHSDKNNTPEVFVQQTFHYFCRVSSGTYIFR